MTFFLSFPLFSHSLDLDDYDFSSADAGASLVTMSEAGQVSYYYFFLL